MTDRADKIRNYLDMLNSGYDAYEENIRRIKIDTTQKIRNNKTKDTYVVLTREIIEFT